jgi:hypothetical protein
MTALAGQSGTVPLFANPFAAVNTGADRDFNLRLASLPYYGSDNRIAVASNCWFTRSG